MSHSSRLFHCARCHCQVIICRRCDRGNVYCFNGCATEARRSSLRRARQRYQGSHRGALANAQRQRRYRARQQKVTHHGSDTDSTAALLQSEAAKRQLTASSAPPARPIRGYCHGCGRPVGELLRNHYLQSAARRRRPP